jgi:S-adenosylmethionine hydrolase
MRERREQYKFLICRRVVRKRSHLRSGSGTLSSINNPDGLQAEGHAMFHSCKILLLLLLAVTGCATGTHGSVALLTDYGNSDQYAGILVGNILRANPRAQVLTISHEIPPFDIVTGAFLLAEAGSEFPPETVLVGIVDPGVGTARAPIVVVTRKGRRLVGPDNGLFDPLIARDGGAAAVYEISNPQLVRAGPASGTFHGRDLFAPVAGHLSRGVPPERVGPRRDDWIRLAVPQAQRSAHLLSGAVIRVDRYGNILSNIPADWLDLPLGTDLQVAVAGQQARARYARTYGDVAEGAWVLVRNAAGQLELARNLASAGATLGVRAGQELTVHLPEQSR